MSGPPRTTRVKILQPQTRVSGAVGDFIEDGSKRRKRRRLYGVVLQATSRNRYMVSFDATPTPIVLEVSSNLLRVEHMAAALPPDVPIPSIANVPEHLQENTQEMIHETVQDQEEEEHLPDSLPESEDMEEEENTAAAEEEAIIDNGQQEQNLPEQSTNQPGQNTTNQQPEQTQPGDQEQDVMGRMPGQLPNQTEAAPTDYANVKRLAKEKIRGLLGTEVTCKSGNKVVKWKVISDHEPEEVLQDEVGKFCLNDFDF
jgi:hypothetical protein